MNFLNKKIIMGVNICICDKQCQSIIKKSSFDCYKKTEEPLHFANVITANNISINNKENSIDENIDDKKMNNRQYKKLFKEKAPSSIQNNIKSILSLTNSNNRNISNHTSTYEKYEKYTQEIIKIQSYFKYFLKMKKIKNNLEIFENEENLSLRINCEMGETVFFSNSFKNFSPKNKDNINNKQLLYNNNIDSNNASNIIIPFNIKNKIKMNYKYSGYITKKQHNSKKDSSKTKSVNSYSIEENEIIDNKEKLGLIKHGFGKFIFNDGTEFCGIFKNNILQNYGKFSNINQKNKNTLNINEKEIIITDNLNYEEFTGEYKDYSPNGFGIYKNYITNLIITGYYNNIGISGIGIEDSVEGGYIYTGEFIDNKKEGYGTIIWKDGHKYKGEFKNNQLNGYGIIEYPEGKVYQGEIKNGKMNGFGEFYWKNENRYIGNYKNDKRNGFGIFIFKSNCNLQNSILDNEIQNNNLNDDNNNEINQFSFYIGFWKNGKMDGFGMKINNLEIKYGLWENGKKRKYLDTNFALKIYIRWIDKRYVNYFLKPHSEILNFLEKCLKYQ